MPLPSKAKSMVLTSMRRWHQTLERSGAGRPVRRSEDTMPTTTALALAPSASRLRRPPLEARSARSVGQAAG